MHSMDPNSNQNYHASFRRSWQNMDHNMQKRHRSTEYATQFDNVRYEREDLPMDAAAMQLCHTFYEPMALPLSAINTYFANDAPIQQISPEYVRHGWELFRNLRFYEAITTYTLDQLIVGHSYLKQSNLVPFYRHIHEDHLQRCRRGPIDSAYFSQRSSTQVGSTNDFSQQPYSAHASLTSSTALQIPGSLDHPGSSLPGFPSVTSTEPYLETLAAVDVPTGLLGQDAERYEGMCNEPTIPQVIPMGQSSMYDNPTDVGRPVMLARSSSPGYNTGFQSFAEISRTSDYGHATVLARSTSTPTANMVHNKVSGSTSTARSAARPPCLRLPLMVTPIDKSLASAVKAGPKSSATSSEGNFQCTYCSKRFAKEGNRDIHEKNFHNHVHTYKCMHEECADGKEYSSLKDGLHKHRLHAHPDCLRTDCQKCGMGQAIIIRPSKKATACGACGKIFRKQNTLLADRAEHIHRHYAENIRDSSFLYSWKQTHWKKSKIVKAFLREPEVHRYWRAKKDNLANRSAYPGYRFDFNWDNCNEAMWDSFIYLAEFGGDEYRAAHFSSEHAQGIVEMACLMANMTKRDYEPSSPFSSRTHSRSTSNASGVVNCNFNSDISIRSASALQSHKGWQGMATRDLPLRQGDHTLKDQSPGDLQSLHQAHITSPSIGSRPKPVDIDPKHHIGSLWPSIISPRLQHFSEEDIIDLQSRQDFMNLAGDSDDEDDGNSRNEYGSGEGVFEQATQRQLSTSKELNSTAKETKSKLRKKLSRRKVAPLEK